MSEPHKIKPVKFAVLAADTAVFTLRDGRLFIRLIAVNRPPHFANISGLPGGLIDPKETAEESAKRHVETKAGIDAKKLYSEQLYTFSRIDRDPRGRVVAVAYLALVPWEKLSRAEQQDSRTATWVPVSAVKKLAYDHNEIIALAVRRLRSRITYTTAASTFMPKEFTLTELETAYENILDTAIDKRNFRKKISKLGILTPLLHKRIGGRFRPAQLYRFTSPRVEEIKML